MSFWMHRKEIPAYVLFIQEWIDVKSLKYPSMLNKKESLVQTKTTLARRFSENYYYSQEKILYNQNELVFPNTPILNTVINRSYLTCVEENKGSRKGDQTYSYI